MTQNSDQVMSMLSCSVDNNMGIDYSSVTTTDCNWETDYDDGSAGTSCWHYWQNYYYPYVIRESYPVYIRERAKDKGKQAFEIIKILKDKKLISLKKVSDFIDLMDALIKIL